MKKKIAIISGFNGTNSATEKGFTDIFGEDYVIDKMLYPKDLSICIFDNYDLIMCSSYYIMSHMEKITSGKIPLIMFERNFDMDSISRLLSIKSGTTIYVTGSNKQGAQEVIELMKNIGLSHLTLIPYYGQFEVAPSDIVMTITPAPLEDIRHERTIEVKFCDLNIYTLMEIFAKLDLPSHRLIPLMKKYMRDELLSKQHTGKMNQNLQGILEITSDGILCVDKNDRTIFCNKTFSSLLGLDYYELISKSYRDIAFEASLLNIIKNSKDAMYEVISYSGKNLIVTKQNMPENVGGFILSIQNVTHIQAVETTVRKKLMEKGFTAKYTLDSIIGTSAIIKTKINEVKKIAGSNFAVLLQGDNGTGKEMFAQAIHNASDRAKYPFVAINLASMPDNLVESELFGYEEGSFTGALKGGKPGLFEMAHKGTIFLDEIGDASPHIQKRLLRVLQEKEIMRLGGNKIIPIDVRVISATNHDLYKLVEEGSFRKDLYYRLKVLYITLPDLKSRSEDIPLFIRHFFDELNSTKYLNDEAVSALRQYPWPGNVRELQNLIYYLEALCDADEITLSNIPEDFRLAQNTEPPLNLEFDKIYALLGDETAHECAVILRSMQGCSNLGKVRLQRIMQTAGVNMTTEQIRNRLRKLSAYELISTGKTRQGNRITEKGLQFLNYISAII